MNKIFTLFSSFLSISLLVSCSLSGKNEYENLISGTEDYYTLDPLNFATAQTNENTKDLFTSHAPFKDQSDMLDLPLEKSVQWNQDDYIHVAQAFNEHLGNDSLDNWKIKMISLNTDCSDIGKGFNQAFLRFFKISELNNQQVRTVLTLDILPWHKIARRYQAVYAPVLENWEVVDLRKIKINASQAAEIAEKNGGSKARANVGDNCFVDMYVLSSGSGYLGWTVNYFLQNSNLKSIFRILIDPQDGSFSVVKL